MTMDVRELRWWAKEAQRKRLEDRLAAISVVRMAMADVWPVRAEVTRLEWSLKLLDLEEDRRGVKEWLESSKQGR